MNDCTNPVSRPGWSPLTPAGGSERGIANLVLVAEREEAADGDIWRWQVHALRDQTRERVLIACGRRPILSFAQREAEEFVRRLAERALRSLDHPTKAPAPAKPEPYPGHLEPGPTFTLGRPPERSSAE